MPKKHDANLKPREARGARGAGSPQRGAPDYPSREDRMEILEALRAKRAKNSAEIMRLTKENGALYNAITALSANGAPKAAEPTPIVVRLKRRFPPTGWLGLTADVRKIVQNASGPVAIRTIVA